MDVDIDFSTDFNPTDVFASAIHASQYNNNKLSKHPAGIYLQNIPIDDISGLAAMPYKQAEQAGFFKIDFLHLSLIDEFSKYLSKAELRELIKIEPNWDLLQDVKVVETLFQLHRHVDLLRQIKPTSMLMLADAIALIRPSGRKVKTAYVNARSDKEREDVRRVLYAKPASGAYYFKKPHALSYAATIVVQLHLIHATRINTT